VLLLAPSRPTQWPAQELSGDLAVLRWGTVKSAET
jgi:hypothetical protein